MNSIGPVFNTFFDCIAYVQCDRTSPCDIQRACLNLFAQHVFGNNATHDAVLRNPRAFCVQSDATEHLAVRLWRGRLKHGSVKKLACRFLAYHDKPKRLMCQYTFAALINETYGITVRFTDDTRWINTSVVSEYIIDGDDSTANTHVTLHKNAQTQWTVMELQTQRAIQQDVTLRVIPLKKHREEFCVRAAFEVGNTLRKNIRVGDMVALGECVYRFDILQWNERATYQIYPASEKATFYCPLPSNTALYLFVYCNASQTLTLAARTTSHDIYLYYKPTSKEMNTLLVAKSTSEETAAHLVRSVLAVK